jgi:hypothetical protein
MAEEKHPRDLGQLTVSEYLYQFQTPLYKVGVGVAVEEGLQQQDSAVRGSLSLVPKQKGPPTFSAQVRKTPHGGAVAFQGEVGPFRGFYSELRGSGERDPVQRAYGASAQMGPVTLYGEQSDASREDRDPWAGQLLRNMEYAKYLENTRINEQNRRIGAVVEGPLGKGVAGLEVAREYRKSLHPNWRGEPRPSVSAPHTTSLRGHYQRPLGPGRLGLQGGVTSERGRRGVSSNLGVDYVVEDPLGLGGRLNAHAGWQSPYEEPSNWQARVRYGLRF